MGRQVILVVEDEVMIRMVTADTLRDAGYHVIEAVSGDEGREILLSGQPVDCIVTDVRMPGTLDGLGLTALSKQLVPGRPVLVVSAERPPSAHAHDFFEKPYLPSMLVKEIEKRIGPPCQTPTTCHRTAS
jgi:CheY-like chemotaxis protein